MVSTMFDEVSRRYDLANDLLSLGNSRLWRIALTRAVGARKGMRVLDVAAGTGTSSAALTTHGAHVVAADFSEGMLAVGRQRQAENPLIEFVHADATKLPFTDNEFDAVTISFGLRNVSDPHRALTEMFRVTKPGGRIVICEFSHPPQQWIRKPYFFYTKHVMPHLAGALTGAGEAYEYLNDSIVEWPNQQTLAAWMREAGFEQVAYRNLSAGIVALHRGVVPMAKPAAKKPAAKKPVAKKPAAKKAATKSAAQ